MEVFENQEKVVADTHIAYPSFYGAAAYPWWRQHHCAVHLYFILNSHEPYNEHQNHSGYSPGVYRHIPAHGYGFIFISRDRHRCHSAYLGPLLCSGFKRMAVAGQYNRQHYFQDIAYTGFLPDHSSVDGISYN